MYSILVHVVQVFMLHPVKKHTLFYYTRRIDSDYRIYEEKSQNFFIILLERGPTTTKVHLYVDKTTQKSPPGGVCSSYLCIYAA